MQAPARSLAAVHAFIEQNRKPCPACGGKPLLTEIHGVDEPTVTMRARCHNSTEELVIPAGHLVEPHRSYDRLGAWLRDMFKLDAAPDMLELFAYNAGKLPGLA